MKALLTFFLVLSVISVTLAQTDTLVAYTGSVTNEESNQAVEATILYEMMPYGSEVGRITSNSSGAYEIFLRGGGRYNFRVQADGYFPFFEVLEVPITGPDNEITKDIKLRPGGVGTVMRLENLIFPQGSAAISEASYVELDQLAASLDSNPDMRIQLEGHTDFRGSASANMVLSQKRVDAVKEYLVSKGIDSKRITTKAFGGTEPLSRENTNEASRLNRRVEVRITDI